MLEIKVLAWDRHINVVGIRTVNGMANLHLMIIGSPTAIQI
jgi:hypothetical protein